MGLPRLWPDITLVDYNDIDIRALPSNNQQPQVQPVTYPGLVQPRHKFCAARQVDRAHSKTSVAK